MNFKNSFLLLFISLNSFSQTSMYHDFDGDGFLSYDEFSKSLTSITGQSAPRAALDAIFSAIDKDGTLLDFDHEELMVTKAIYEQSRRKILIAERFFLSFSCTDAARIAAGTSSGDDLFAKRAAFVEFSFKLSKKKTLL